MKKISKQVGSGSGQNSKSRKYTVQPKSKTNFAKGKNTSEESVEPPVNVWEDVEKDSIQWKILINSLILDRNMFISGPGGVGKCLHPDTPVIMYNGTIKLAKQIKTGDLLMGDDSTPRTVLNTCTGIENMYRINQRNGDSYIVNEPHVLSLKSQNCIVDIPLNKYVEKSDEWKKNHKGFKVGVEFEELDLKFDPYVIGAWLSDSRSTSCDFVELNSLVLKEISNRLKIYDLQLIESPSASGKFKHYTVVDKNIDLVENGCSVFENVLKSYNLLDKKNIPFDFTRNSRQVRLQLLAGLIDSSEKFNGEKFSGEYEIVQRSKTLAQDILFLCRSLGFATSLNEIDNGNFYKISFHGGGIEEIPCVVWKVNNSTENSNSKDKNSGAEEDALTTEIDIEPLGLGNYCGFMLDGNCRFLLGDFTVTHNTFIIQKIIQLYKDRKINHAVCASTGVAAVSVGGSTLHSFLKLGLADKPAEELVKQATSSKYHVEKWKKLQVLFIDEISMVDFEFLDKIDKVARACRGIHHLPFGGIKLILIGDFCQLPPVQKGRSEIFYLFESATWKQLNLKNFLLTKTYRQTDEEFVQCLNRIRLGRQTSGDIELLKTRLHVKPELSQTNGIAATQLYALCNDVDMINKAFLDEIKYPVVEYTAISKWDTVDALPNQAAKKAMAALEQKFYKDSPVEKVIQLKLGAQVMLTCNVNQKIGLVNGSRGVVIDFTEGTKKDTERLPIVRFLNGIEMEMPRRLWKLGDPHAGSIQFFQIPLKMAWSLTIHKCVSEGTLLYTGGGLRRIEDLALHNQQSGTFETIDLLVHSEKGVNKADQIYKGHNESAIKIRTTSGYELTGSHRHPVRVYTGDGQHAWKKLPEIEIGDTIVLKIGTECFGAPITTEGFNSKQFENEDLDSVDTPIIPKEIDGELCYLLGLIVRSGGVNQRGEIECCNSRELTIIRNCIFELFACTGITTVRGWCLKLKLESKLIEFFDWIGIQNCEFENGVPQCVLQNTKEAQIEFLKGVFGLCDKIMITPSCSTASSKLAREIQIMLLNIGIIAQKEVINWIGDTHIISINPYYSYLFSQMIGFEYSKQKNELDLFEAVGHKTGIIPDGLEILGKFVDEYSLLSEDDQQGGGQHKNDVEKIYNGSETKNDNLIELSHAHLSYLFSDTRYTDQCKHGRILKDMLDCGFLYDRVQSIENCEAQMYDIHVPNDNTFVANGIVNHNCQGTSLDFAVMSIDKNMFAPGQAYVALSRMRNLNGLFLTNFDPVAFKVDKKVVAFYEELEKQQDDYAVATPKRKYDQENESPKNSKRQKI